jgi:hypothetical protein
MALPDRFGGGLSMTPARRTRQTVKPENSAWFKHKREISRQSASKRYFASKSRARAFKVY